MRTDGEMDNQEDRQTDIAELMVEFRNSSTHLKIIRNRGKGKETALLI